jgi:hypothetical protein
VIEGDDGRSVSLQQAVHDARKELEVYLMAREGEGPRDVEHENRVLDATGTDFEALDRQASTLLRIKEIEGAVVLAEISHKQRLTPSERHWEERVLGLEQLLAIWKRKWDGMSYWQERRLRMELGLMVSERDWREYSEHVAFGETLRDGVTMLFSWLEGVRVPDDVAVVLSLSRRATNIAVDVSIGLERLRVSKIPSTYTST